MLRTLTPPPIPTALAAVALLAACSGPRASAPLARAEFRAAAFRVLDLRDAALNAHDVDAAARAYLPDAEVIDADSGQVVLRGREEIRAAHARFLEACPRARVDVLDRSYSDAGQIVTDVERVVCDRPPPVDGWVRYQIVGGAIVRVLKHGSPPFEG